MGRHASSGQRSAPAPAAPRQTGLLGWGLFVSVLLGAASPALGLPAAGAAAAAVTSAVVFLALWLLSGTAGRTVGREQG